MLIKTYAGHFLKVDRITLRSFSLFQRMGKPQQLFLNSGGALPDEYWFRRPQEFLVCKVDSQSSCSGKTGKLVSFDRNGSWEINEMSELICLQ